MTSVERYTLYGDLTTRDAVVIATLLAAKGLAIEQVEETPSLSLALASRSGHEQGPYLHTPEGAVLADLRSILDWVDRSHPEPRLLPTAPVRRACALLLEDWVELWLPLWPGRSWATLERLESHLASSRFLMGPRPVRADWILAAWLETDVLVHPHARGHVEQNASRLARLAEDLLGLGACLPPQEDDAVPISLLAILEEIAGDYHTYLERNHRALEAGQTQLRLDLGDGRSSWPVRPECERRRVAIRRDLTRAERATRRLVAGVLEPVGAWRVLALPPVLEALDPADPRSL